MTHTKTKQLELADKLMLGDIFKGNKYEFIINACNSHDDLLEACKEALDIINSYSHIPAQFKACEILQQAIKKAEGKQ